MQNLLLKGWFSFKVYKLDKTMRVSMLHMGGTPSHHPSYWPQVTRGWLQAAMTTSPQSKVSYLAGPVQICFLWPHIKFIIEFI